MNPTAKDLYGWLKSEDGAAKLHMEAMRARAAEHALVGMVEALLEDVAALEAEGALLSNPVKARCAAARYLLSRPSARVPRE